MPDVRKVRKRQALQVARKRGARGRLYLAAILIVVIGAGVGLYVYESSQSGPPDFMIAAPEGITVYAGQRTTSVINVTAVNRFDGTVHLSVSGSNGVTVQINPVNVTGSGTATLGISASANGTYTVTVTGTSGSLTHTVAPRVATPVYGTLVTSNGTMVVELYQAQTPQTVSNFVNLANQGFYHNLCWHRIVKGFVIQTGDPKTLNCTTDRSTWGTGGSSQTVPLEIDSSLHNNIGYLGMARSTDANSGSSQFYINLANNNSLDGNYTVFGKVISGMDVAFAIGNVPVNSSDQPINPVLLTDVTISPS